MWRRSIAPRRCRRFGPHASGRLLLVAVAAVCGTIIALGVGWWDWAGRSLPQQKPTVAILPFVNLGDDATTERLAAGITQDIVTDLTRFHDLDVIASTTMRAAAALDLARNARTGYVLTGAIQRQRERVRVSAQLVNSGWGRTSGPSAGIARPGTSSRSKSRWRSRSRASIGGYGRIVEADWATARRKSAGQPYRL